MHFNVVLCSPGAFFFFKELKPKKDKIVVMYTVAKKLFNFLTFLLRSYIIRKVKINRINRKVIEKFLKTKSWFLRRLFFNDKSLPNLTKVKKRRESVSKARI